MYEVGFILEKLYNLMINFGVIIVSSFLKFELVFFDRFDWVIFLLYFKLIFICDNFFLYFFYDKWSFRN